MVRQGQAGGLAQQRLYRGHHVRITGPAAEYLVAAIGLAQPAHRAAPFGLARGGRAGIAEIGLELHRRHGGGQMFAGHVLQRGAHGLAGKAAQHDVATRVEFTRQAGQTGLVGQGRGGVEIEGNRGAGGAVLRGSHRGGMRPI
ncbi:hypothetical protein D3C72_1297280 [compost metagenome]